MRAFTKKESVLSFIHEVEKDSPVVGIENIHGIKHEKPVLIAWGLTLHNLLGKSGNFENSTYLTGAYFTPSLTSAQKVFGTNGLSLEITNTGNANFYKSSILIAGHVYFASFYIKPEANDDGESCSITPHFNGFITSKLTIPNVWQKLSFKESATSNIMRFYYGHNDSTKTVGKKIYIDGMVLIDLTALSELLQPLKDLWQVDNWTDVPEAELDDFFSFVGYFDSVKSIGWDFINGYAEIKAENRGKNLAKLGFSIDDTGPDVGSNTNEAISRFLNNDILIGATRDGAIHPSKITSYSIDRTTNSITFNTTTSGYGIGIKIPCKPNTQYKFSETFRYGLYNSKGINIGFGTAEGVTTPENCAYIMLVASIIPVGTGLHTVSNIQLEEGTEVTKYVPPRQDLLSIPTELHGWAGAYDTWAGNQKTARVSRETKTADGSGNLALSGYKAGSQAIIINNTTGEVQIKDAAASIVTGWINQVCTVLYLKSTPTTEEVKGTGGFYIYEGQNNIIMPFGSILYTGEGTDELLAFVRNLSISARSESIRFKPHFSTKKRTILTRRGYEISFEDPELEWDIRQFEDTRFTIEEKLDNDDDVGLETVRYHGCAIKELETGEDDVTVQRVRLLAETKEVL